MTKQLYICNIDVLENSNKPDVALWSNMHSIASTWAPYIDRCESIQMPYRLKLYDKFKMPKDLSGFNLSYEECCNIQAQEFIDLSKKLDKKITIMYSGGIDSTLIVIFFLKLLGESEFKNRIDIALSQHSISENPNFYYRYIRPIGNIISSNHLTNMFTGSTIIVSGEHNDQLFGSDLICHASNYSGFAEMHKPYSRKHFVGFLTQYKRQEMTEKTANFFFDLIDNHIKTQAPCEVTTNYHLWWWLNFSFKWQNVFFRMLLRANKLNFADINQSFVDNYYHCFFSGTNFQKWSMLNHNLKVVNSWDTYKWEAKRLIYDFTKDKDYLNKIKIGSLVEIFRQRDAPAGITSNYEFLENLNLDEFYVPDNSFRI